MPRLPDALSLGEYPTPQVRGPTPSAGDANAGAIGQGMASAAQGLSSFGSAIGGIGSEESNKNASLEIARADTLAQQRLYDAHREFQNDSDADTVGARFGDRVNQIKQEAKGIFTKDESWQKYEPRFESHALRYQHQIDTQADHTKQQLRQNDFENKVYQPRIDLLKQNPTLQGFVDLDHSIDINVHSKVLTPLQGAWYKQRARTEFGTHISGGTGRGANAGTPATLPGGDSETPGPGAEPSGTTVASGEGAEGEEGEPPELAPVGVPTREGNLELDDTPDQPPSAKTATPAMTPEQAEQMKGSASGPRLVSAPPGTIVARTAQPERAIGANGYAKGMQGQFAMTLPDGTVHTYDFTSGGAGRGAIPFGTYGIGEKQQFLGADAWQLADHYDPATKDNRDNLLIHRMRPGREVTAGCIGIPSAQYDQFQRDMAAGGMTSLTLAPAASSEGVQGGTPSNLGIDTQGVLQSVSQNKGMQPGVLSALIQTESGWKTSNPTGKYDGLTQIGRDTFDEAGGTLAGMSYDQYLKAPAAAQIRAYEAWLDHYDFDAKMQRNGIDFANLPADKQAAVLQAFQFGPNDESWMRKAGQGNYSDPVTHTKQAGVLGDTSIDDMAAYYRGAVGRTQYAQADTGTATDARYDTSKMPDYMRYLYNDSQLQKWEGVRQYNLQQAHKQYLAANQQAAEAAITGDIARIRDGAQPLPRPDGSSSIDALGEFFQGSAAGRAKYEKLRQEWNTAHFSAGLRAPLVTMDPLRANQFFTENAPDPADARLDYQAASAAHRKAHETFEEIDKMRNTDPARSVSGFKIPRSGGKEEAVPAGPHTRAAIAQAQADTVEMPDGSWAPGPRLTDQQKWGLIMKARRADQEAAGLDEGQQRGLTMVESEKLLDMTKADEHEGTIFTEKMDDAAKRALRQFGPENAASALGDAIKNVLHKSVDDTAVHKAMIELQNQKRLSDNTVGALLNHRRIAPLDDYTAQQQGLRPNFSLGIPPMSNTAYDQTPPSKQDLATLKANPGNWQWFEGTYGAGSVARALGGTGTKEAPTSQPTWQTAKGFEWADKGAPYGGSRTGGGTFGGSGQWPGVSGSTMPPQQPGAAYGGNRFGGNRFGGGSLFGVPLGGARFGGNQLGAGPKRVAAPPKAMETQ